MARGVGRMWCKILLVEFRGLRSVVLKAKGIPSNFGGIG